MTEEDARKTTQMAAKSLIHVSVKFGKKAADKSTEIVQEFFKENTHLRNL